MYRSQPEMIGQIYCFHGHSSYNCISRSISSAEIKKKLSKSSNNNINYLSDLSDLDDLSDLRYLRDLSDRRDL